MTLSDTGHGVCELKLEPSVLHTLHEKLLTFSDMSETEFCPHIRVIEIEEVKVYAIMESRCHFHEEPTCIKRKKEDDTFLRILATHNLLNRGSETVVVTVILSSEDRHSLSFPEGKVKDHRSILNLEEKPLRIFPFYKKKNIPDFANVKVPVEMNRQDEDQFIPVKVVASTWEKYPRIEMAEGETLLKVTIPPH